jgi:uncharacterized membrane protein
MKLLMTIPLHIQIHIVFALIALLLGGIVLSRRKGTLVHKWMGRVWVAAMVIVAVGSFWIRNPKNGSMGFSWIHLLSIWILISLTLAIYFARKRNFKAHKGFMIGSYVGLAVAGAFTLVPGRILHMAVFG